MTTMAAASSPAQSKRNGQLSISSYEVIHDGQSGKKLPIAWKTARAQGTRRWSLSPGRYHANNERLKKVTHYHTPD